MQFPTKIKGILVKSKIEPLSYIAEEIVTARFGRAATLQEGHLDAFGGLLEIEFFTTFCKKCNKKKIKNSANSYFDQTSVAN